MKPTRTIQSWLSGKSLQSTTTTRYAATVAAGIAIFSAASLSAADIQWIGDTGTYNDPANWQNGVVPSAFDNAFVSNGGTAQVLPGDPTWWVIDLRAAQGAGTTGHYEVSGSRVNLVEWLRVGIDGTASFTMSDGFFNMLNPGAGRINIGETGSGTLNLSGGIIDQKGGRTTFGERGGANVTSTGTLNMTGGLFNNGGEVWVGQGGSGSEIFGTMNVSDGNFVSGSWFVFGRAGGDGELNLSGGTLHKPANGGNMIVGDRAGVDGSTGIVNQSGGSFIVGSETWIGQGGRLVGTDPETNEQVRDRASGIYNLSAGDLTVANWTVLGRDGGTGVFNLSGGTLNKVGPNQFIIGAGVGADATQSSGVLNHTGGLFNIEQGELWIAENNSAQGTYNLSGNAELRAGTIALGQAAGATPTATLNLNGGTARVAQIIRRSTAAGSSATVNFNGGLLIPTGSRPDFITGLTAANLQDGGFNIDTNGFHVGTPQVFAAPGNGGLVKSGLGTFTLAATANLPASGAVAVTRGVLEVDGSLSGGSVTIGDGAALSGAGTVLGPVTFAAGSALLADSLEAEADQRLAFIGHVNVTGPARVDFSDFAGAGTYTVGTFTGTFTGAANLTLGRPGTVTATGGIIQATIQAPRSITWTGSQNSVWDIFTTANWTSGGAVAFGQADTVNFGDAAGSAPVTITGPVRPDRVNVNNNAGNTITLVGSATGSIEGAPLIEKSGTGKLVIALDNPLVAPAGVDVLAGELQFGNGGNAGSLGTALVFAEENTVVSLDFGSAKTLWNTFSGSGSLVKNGSETVTLAGNTPFSGNTTINSGRLVFQSPAAPASPTITNNGELEISHTAGAVLQVGTVIGGSGKLIKSGDSEVWLNAANTFSGDVEVVRGPVNSLNITHAQALGTTDGKTIVRGRNGNTGQHLNIRLITGGGTTIAEPLEFHASALGRTGLRHEGANQTLTLSGPISANSTGLAAVQIHNHLANSTLNLTGDITGTMNGGGIFLRGSTGPINITGGINLDFADIVVTDSARITLGGAGKTYSGFRTNIAFGHLRTLVDNALDPAQPVNLGQNNTGQEARLILGAGTTPVQQTLSAITVNNPAPTSGIFGGASTPSTLTLNMNRNTTIPLPIGGGGTNENNLNLEKTGPGVLTLSAAINPYTGTTTVSGGRLVVNGNTSASPYTINAGGTVGGTGTIGSVTASGSAAATANLSPADNGIGILTAFGTVNLGAHSALNTQIGDWNGVAGTGNDLLNVGNLSVTATAADPVRIRLTGLNLQNFENVDRSFTIVQASGSITGFEPSKFVVDASALPQADGTWSVRQDEGRLVVDFKATVPSGSPFEDWAIARGLGADVDPSADPDNDTVPNLIEFVIGGEPNPANPDSNSLALLPTVATTDDSLVFTFRLSAGAEELEADAVYVQYSSNLTTWETAAAGTAGITSSTVAHPTEEGIKLVTVTIPSALAGPDGKLFARLAAELP